jgi:glycosyltransferase involved in cell wall biosynthesis
MLILCPFPQGVAAGQRLKYEQYLDDWRAHGWDVTVSSFMDRALWDIVYTKGHLLAKTLGVLRGHARRLRDMLRIGRYDLVYVFMWVTPFGTTGFERLTRARAKALIYDVEDNFLASTKPDAADAPNPLARLIKRPGKAQYLTAASDAVIVASPYLVEACRAVNRHKQVRCIPPSLDVGRIHPAAPGTPRPDRVVIGWTGTFSSRAYLDLLGKVFLRLASRAPFTLRVIGNFDYALPGVDLDVLRWSAEREAEDLKSLDIGVYPLPDDEWTRGKAGLKIIQYQAAGLPCVASDVPLSRAQLRDGETGFLVANDDEWVDRLEQLIRDPGLRCRMGAAGRRDAVACYSHDAIAPAYRALFDEVSAASVG